MPDLSDDRAQAELAARAHFYVRHRLPMWTIYRPTTSDFPGQWVGRLHVTLPETYPTQVAVFGQTLQEVRDKLPYGLDCLMRFPDDDANIEEVWL
jgi:hypothetical protein